MRIVNHLKTFVSVLFLASSIGLIHASPAPTGELWFGSQGPTTGTASGTSDDRVGYIDSDATGLTTIGVDPGTNSYYSVGLDTNDNLYFALSSDGILLSGFLSAGEANRTYAGTNLGNLVYVGEPGDAQYVSSTTDIAQLETADSSRDSSADSPAVYARGPFGTLASFNASYQLLGDNVPPGTSPYWVVWVNAPGDLNPDDEIAIIQYSIGNTLNVNSTIHVVDPNGVIGSYSGETLDNLDNTSLGTYTFGQMTVDFAGVEIGNWGVASGTSASADVESMTVSYVAPNTVHQVQITDVPDKDLAYAFAVDPTKHLIYLGLWGADDSGADLIKVPYNPATGQMISPYDPTIGEITNESGVLLSSASTGDTFVMVRQMWVAPGGGLIYYVDNDFGNPEGFFPDVRINGVYVVNPNVANPQPEQLTLDSQFPTDNSLGYIVGLAVNQAKGLIYFATSGESPGMGTASNTIWSMSITGGAATAMPMPKGVSLVYPNFSGGCLALDPNAQTLYVSDEGAGTVMQLSLSADGLSFTGGAAKFFTLDSSHLKDGVNGYPSAFVQGLEFDSTSIVSPPPPVPQLSIVRQGPNVLVSWSTKYSGYTLQSAAVLAHSAWAAYPGPFLTNSGTITATNKIAPVERFFRLSD